MKPNIINLRVAHIFYPGPVQPSNPPGYVHAFPYPTVTVPFIKRDGGNSTIIAQDHFSHAISLAATTTDPQTLTMRVSHTGSGKGLLQFMRFGSHLLKLLSRL